MCNSLSFSHLFLSTQLSTLKYYFAVDTACVVRKLGLLLFPFAHDRWEVQYQEGEPVQPRHDANAPDLYIPLMAFVTYICVAGYVLGAKDQCVFFFFPFSTAHFSVP
jgi:hypothetical protein